MDNIHNILMYNILTIGRYLRFYSFFMLFTVGIYVEVNSWNNFIRTAIKLFTWCCWSKTSQYGQPVTWEEPRLLGWMDGFWLLIYFYHLLNWRPWVSHFISLSLSFLKCNTIHCNTVHFLKCNTGKIIVISHSSFKNYRNAHRALSTVPVRWTWSKTQKLWF